MKAIDDHREDLIGEPLLSLSRAVTTRTVTTPPHAGPEDRPAHNRCRDLRIGRPIVRLVLRRFNPSQQQLVELASGTCASMSGLNCRSECRQPDSSSNKKSQVARTSAFRLSSSSPGLSGSLRRWLTPLAALGLVLTMIGAALTHLRRTEYGSIAMNVVLLVLAAFVVYGRFFVLPA